MYVMMIPKLPLFISCLNDVYILFVNSGRIHDISKFHMNIELHIYLTINRTTFQQILEAAT